MARKKDDFNQPIEWWTWEKFRGRSITIQTKNEKDGEVFLEEDKINIPDTEPVVCDMCNNDIKVFPCAVVTAMALCRECQVDRWNIGDGDDEYFESFNYRMEVEDRKPGVNMGGRKRAE